MKIRLTIMLDQDLSKKLRDLQGRMMRVKKENVSFSQVINEVLQRGLKSK